MFLSFETERDLVTVRIDRISAVRFHQHSTGWVELTIVLDSGSYINCKELVKFNKKSILFESYKELSEKMKDIFAHQDPVLVEISIGNSKTIFDLSKIIGMQYFEDKGMGNLYVTFVNKYVVKYQDDQNELGNPGYVPIRQAYIQLRNHLGADFIEVDEVKVGQ